MANFFSDNKDLQFHLGHPMMRKIVELKERGFAEKDLYDFAPQDFEDAMDSYRRVLEIAGEVCGEVIAVRDTRRRPCRPRSRYIRIYCSWITSADLTERVARDKFDHQ